MIFNRRKTTTGGQNLAIIYSIRHRLISDVKPFVVSRKYDKVKNIEETKAIFPTDLKKDQQSQGIGGLFGFFKNLLSPPPKLKGDEEEGAIFSEALAVYNKSRKGWLTVYSLETYTQLPLVSGSYDIDAKMLEMQRNVERRVSRLKTSQLEITNLQSITQPISTFSKILLIGAILIFIAALSIAYSVSILGNAITASSKVLADLSGKSIVSTGTISIFLKPPKRKKNEMKDEKVKEDEVKCNGCD